MNLRCILIDDILCLENGNAIGIFLIIIDIKAIIGGFNDKSTTTTTFTEFYLDDGTVSK